MTGLRLALISPNQAIVVILFLLTFIKGTNFNHSECLQSVSYKCSSNGLLSVIEKSCGKQTYILLTLIFSFACASEFYYPNNKVQNYNWRISKGIHLLCSIRFHSFPNYMFMEIANAYNWCGISWCYLSIYPNLLSFEIQTRQSSNDTCTMGHASGWSHIFSWSTSSDKKVKIGHSYHMGHVICKICVSSFLSLVGHQSRQSKAHIRILSTFFIGSSVTVMDYCSPVGNPEDDNQLVYGNSQSLNKIKYYQETIR